MVSPPGLQQTGIVAGGVGRQQIGESVAVDIADGHALRCRSRRIVHRCGEGAIAESEQHADRVRMVVGHRQIQAAVAVQVAGRESCVDRCRPA